MKKVDQAQINDVAWRACDTFRGVLNAADYMNYILAMLFVKYISDVWKDHLDENRRQYKGDEQMVKRRMSRERFVLPEGCDFDSLYAQRNESDIGQIINIALAKIEEENRLKLEGVFREIDFNSENKLGQTKERAARLKSFLEDFADPRLDLRPSVVGNEDVIGNVYEYLLGNFASNAGKKAGEFYTPGMVSRLMAKLLNPKKGDTICDPTCGSGSLLIRVANETPEHDYAIFGQEVNGSTHALCRMNMFLHGIDGARIEWGDTIRNPRLVEQDQLMNFDIVVANPPFSLEKWGIDEAGSDAYNRFHRGLPTKSRGDYAFISHMIETARPNTGKVAVIVPHGVLFRGASEGKIRQRLIEENLLEAVIGLPANMFFGTGIPTAIMIFNKGKAHGDVLFIEASREYKEVKNRNDIDERILEKIVQTYRSFETIEKYSYRATFQEIADNDFNLNIPRYVDTFEPEAEIDLEDTQKEIQRLESELAVIQARMKNHLKALGLDNSH